MAPANTRMSIPQVVGISAVSTAVKSLQTVINVMGLISTIARCKKAKRDYDLAAAMGRNDLLYTQCATVRRWRAFSHMYEYYVAHYISSQDTALPEPLPGHLENLHTSLKKLVLSVDAAHNELECDNKFSDEDGRENEPAISEIFGAGNPDP